MCCSVDKIECQRLSFSLATSLPLCPALTDDGALGGIEVLSDHVWSTEENEGLLDENHDDRRAHRGDSPRDIE